MQEEVFEVSLEILDAVPVVIAAGMAGSCLVVVAAIIVVSGFKALIRMIGR